MQIVPNVSSRNKLSFIFSASEEQTFIYIYIYIYIPRLTLQGRQRSFTEKYDDLHDAVLRSHISVTVYGQIQ
jgi:hypothetical protein